MTGLITITYPQNEQWTVSVLTQGQDTDGYAETHKETNTEIDKHPIDKCKHTHSCANTQPNQI